VILVNWWSILKLEGYEVSDRRWNELQKPNQNQYQQQTQLFPKQPTLADYGVPQQTVYPNQPTQARQQMLDTGAQGNIALQPQQGIQQQQQIQAQQQLQQQQAQNQQQLQNVYLGEQVAANKPKNVTQDASGGDADGADDSDVGEVRANVADAKNNLTQLPRGPFAAQVTEALKLLSQAAIDPVKQKEIAIEAKRLLHRTFPSSMA
tara:strand:- start:188 stop:805 length:618 start_codon:yes stop_codon:yes gene_type:complete